jgi:hypothetical protein
MERVVTGFGAWVGWVEARRRSFDAGDSGAVTSSIYQSTSIYEPNYLNLAKPATSQPASVTFHKPPPAAL